MHLPEKLLYIWRLHGAGDSRIVLDDFSFPLNQLPDYSGAVQPQCRLQFQNPVERVPIDHDIDDYVLPAHSYSCMCMHQEMP